MTSADATWSLRARLLTIGAFACTAALLVGGAAMYHAADIEDQAMLDLRLASLAQVLLGFSVHEAAGPAREDAAAAPTPSEARATLGSRYAYQLWSADGRLLVRSDRAPASEPIGPLTGRGFDTARLGGEIFRTFAQQDPRNGQLIQVAELLRDRDTAIDVVIGYFASFLAMPLVLVLAGIGWLLNRALHAIESYALQLRQRHPLDLTPLHDAGPPAELMPMIVSINSLFARIDQALSVERDFTAVAAHEMRTPLASLRAQAQLARRADSPQQLSKALGALIEGIDHANHLQNQLLDLARIDKLSAGGEQPVRAVNLHHVYHQLMSDLGPAMAEKELSVQARFDVAEVQGIELGLHLLMHNLLLNAVRYTPRGGRIEISSQRDDRAVTLAVEDSGHGIPESRRAQALERFNRLGRNDADGAGLGLSIVQSVVLAHHADLRLLDSPLGGLKVEVRFPLAAAA